MSSRISANLIKMGMLGISVLAILLVIAPHAHAQENIATYPTLPYGYTSIKIFDIHGRFAGRILPDKRYWVPIDRIPIFLQNAVVAVEDSRFYEHNGIDIRGIARALVKDVVKRKMAEGGSTITQQLIKNKFLSGEKTLDRKIKEAQLAMDFERKYTKRQILEMYFNEIYYGNGAWGIAQAARLYFDKNPEELTDGECALLAGVQKSPGRYNPLGKAARVTGRRDVVLKRMVELRMISSRQQKELRAHPPAVVPTSQAPWYLAHVRARLAEQFGPAIIDQGGLEVTAALDLDLQKRAEQALREGAKKVSPELQGALLCMDPGTGDILAVVGGVDYQKSAYDRAFTARRQPGSAIKPMIYAAALEKGITAASIWNDAPVAYNGGNGGTWQPENYEGKSYGDLTLRQALAHSNNVITVKLLDTITIPYFIDFAAKMGLPFAANSGLSLALGAQEVTLKDLLLAYAPLATGGVRAEPRTIIRIYDHNRHAWIENPSKTSPVLAPATAFITTRMLMDVLNYGTAKSLKKFGMAHPAAGKTGTTSDYRDAWFVGYTPQLVTGVWLGYDQPRPGGKGFTGGAAAAPIWGKFMTAALAGRPAVDFTKPETVVTAIIDPSTGLLATPDCPNQQEEFFIPGTEPTEYCAKHGGKFIRPLSPPMPRSGIEEQKPDPEREGTRNGTGEDLSRP